MEERRLVSEGSDVAASESAPLTKSEDRLFRADATIHIEASTHDAAQGQMMDWVADHMPGNFHISWTLPIVGVDDRFRVDVRHDFSTKPRTAPRGHDASA